MTTDPRYFPAQADQPLSLDVALAARPGAGAVVPPARRDAALTESVLAAMSELETLFQQGPVLLQPEPPRARVIQPLPPPPAVRREPSTRGGLAGHLLLALVGGALALVAGCAVPRLSRPRPLPASRIQPLPQVPLTPAMAAYRARAEGGDEVAMRLMATCYREGMDTAPDAREEARWAARAALAKHPGF